MHRAVKRAFRQRFISEIDAIPSRESNCAIFGNAGETIVREEEEEDDDDELRALVERRCRGVEENGGCAAAGKRAPHLLRTLSATLLAGLCYLPSDHRAKFRGAEAALKRERKRESAGATRLLAFRAA